MAVNLARSPAIRRLRLLERVTALADSAARNAQDRRSDEVKDTLHSEAREIVSGVAELRKSKPDLMLALLEGLHPGGCDRSR